MSDFQATADAPSCTTSFSEASRGKAEKEDDDKNRVNSTENNENRLPVEVETDAQRIERELHESEQLAYAMMREEAEQAYTMQLEFMRDNANNLSAEDLAALRAAVGLSVLPARRHEVVSGADTSYQSGDNDEANTSSDSVNSNASGASAAWSDPNNYERLLALGSEIGDVKTERWRLRAQSVIDSLPHISYKEILRLSQPAIHIQGIDSDAISVSTSNETNFVGNAKSTASTVQESPQQQHHKLADILDEDAEQHPHKRLCLRTIDSTCSVCMEKFEEVESLQLVLLPCSHYLHDDCIKAWMSDNNSCPICLAEVSPA